VLQNKEDIADFVIFSSDNKLQERSFSRLVPYNVRSQTIRSDFVKVSSKCKMFEFITVTTNTLYNYVR